MLEKYKLIKFAKLSPLSSY